MINRRSYRLRLFRWLDHPREGPKTNGTRDPGVTEELDDGVWSIYLCNVLLARVDERDDVLRARVRRGVRFLGGITVWPRSSSSRYEPQRDAS